MTPSDCPTVLSLERLLSGELTGATEAALKAHVRSCAQCAARLQAMERQAAEFSRSPRSAPARAAFHRADRAWKRNAMLAVTVPLAAAVLAAVSPQLFNRPTVPTTQWARVHARSAPTWLEPRGNEGPARLRQLSIRGRPVAFGEGALEGAAGDGASRPFVLKHTDVEADVSGFVSSVTVTQEFENPFGEPVEAVYVFPLPDDAAVDEMTLSAGERVIRAQIQKREVARRMYEEAKQQGRRAALLDQERPNIFTQSVANLLPARDGEGDAPLRGEAALRRRPVHLQLPDDGGPPLRAGRGAGGRVAGQRHPLRHHRRDRRLAHHPAFGAHRARHLGHGAARRGAADRGPRVGLAPVAAGACPRRTRRR